MRAFSLLTQPSLGTLNCSRLDYSWIVWRAPICQWRYLQTWAKIPKIQVETTKTIEEAHSPNISYFVSQYRCRNCSTLVCVSPEYAAWLCVSPTQFLSMSKYVSIYTPPASGHQPPAEARGYTAAPASRLYIEYTSHNRHTSGRCHAPCHDDESPRVTNVSIPHLIVLHICTVYSAALYSSAVLYSAAAHDWHWHCFVLSRVFLDAISISGGVAVRALRNISSFSIPS